MQPGDFVTHPTFGTGRVINTSGDKAEVFFESGEHPTLLASALTLLESAPLDKVWRLRDGGNVLAAESEATRIKSPALAAAFESFLVDLSGFVPTKYWSVDPKTASLVISTLSEANRIKQIAFVGLGKRPPRLIVGVTDMERLPNHLHQAFQVEPKGFHNGPYLRAELAEDALSRLPDLLTALRELIAASAV